MMKEERGRKTLTLLSPGAHPPLSAPANMFSFGCRPALASLPLCNSPKSDRAAIKLAGKEQRSPEHMWIGDMTSNFALTCRNVNDAGSWAAAQ